VDHHVAAGERGTTGVVEAEAVAADVTADRGDPPVHQRGEAVLAQLVAEAIEGVVAEDLALGPLLDGGLAARPDQQDELAVRDAAHEPLDQGRPEEAGAAGDGDALAGELLGDHGTVVYQMVETLARAARRTPDRILDQAMVEFGTRGYEATSLDDLAGRLGIRKQTILYWFPSKEVLLEAVVDRCADEVTDRLVAGLARADEGFGRIEAMVRVMFRLAARYPEMLGFLREVTRLGPPASTRLLERLGPLVTRAAGFLEAEMDAGRMRRHDPRLLLLAAYSMVTGMATEVEVLRAFGEEATLASLVRRRDELLNLLRAALEP
jgi:TetR/AcrR family transcriptional regulator